VTSETTLSPTPRCVVTRDTPSIAAGMANKGAPGACTPLQPASSKSRTQKGRKKCMQLKDAKEVNELQIFA
jgi:hypothetical protein